jgi:hypothetical protein
MTEGRGSAFAERLLAARKAERAMQLQKDTALIDAFRSVTQGMAPEQVQGVLQKIAAHDPEAVKRVFGLDPAAIGYEPTATDRAVNAQADWTRGHYEGDTPMAAMLGTGTKWGEDAQAIFQAQALNPSFDAAGTAAHGAGVKAGKIVSADKGAEVAEQGRQFDTEWPFKKNEILSATSENNAQAYSSNQSGNYYREQATNEAQQRDINSPYMRTQVTADVEKAKGRETAKAAPGTKAGQKFIEDHATIKGHNKRLTDLVNKGQKLEEDRAKETDSDKRERLTLAIETVNGQIEKEKAVRNQRVDQLRKSGWVFKDPSLVAPAPRQGTPSPTPASTPAPARPAQAPAAPASGAQDMSQLSTEELLRLAAQG